MNLTPTQKRILARLVEGDNYQEAGDAIGMNPNTLCWQVKMAVKANSCRSKSQLIAKYISYLLGVQTAE